MKRVLRIVIFACILTLIFTISAFAEDVIHRGEHGELSWEFNETTGALTISGEGEMDDFLSYYQSAWHPYKNMIKSVVIEEGVTTIGREAFYYFTELETVTLPETLTSIGESAFEYNIAIKSIKLPDSLIKIDRAAFAKCSGIEEITIPDGVSEIGVNAFFYCSFKTVELPKSLTAIWEGVFNMSKLESIVIPEGVTEIGREAFYACNELKSVTLPSTLQTIGYNAFGSCDSLTSISIPDSVTDIGHSSFSYCAALKSVKLPVGIKEIPNATFTHCTALESVEIPEGVVEIKASAFESCHSLKDVKLPSTLKTIGAQAFMACKSLESIVIPARVKTIEGAAFAYCSSIKNIDIPTSVNTLGGYAFQDCVKLESISLPAYIQRIETGLFSGCTSLRDILVAEGNTYFKSVDGVLYTIDGATLIKYPAKSQNTIFYLPAEVTSIGEYAFQGSLYLEEVVISHNRKIVFEEGAFANCTKLKYFLIPEGTDVIPSYMFSDCTSLEFVRISSTVDKVFSLSFKGCTALGAVYIDSIDVAKSLNSSSDNTGIIKNAKSIFVDAQIDAIIGGFRKHSITEEAYFGDIGYISYSSHEHSWEKQDEKISLIGEESISYRKCSECGAVKGKSLASKLITTISFAIVAIPIYMAVAPILTVLIIFIYLKSRKTNKTKEQLG